MAEQLDDTKGQTQDQQPDLEHEMDPPPDYNPRYEGSNRLAGMVALVTGGDSGIGRATSVLFAREGARVVIVYKNEHEDARKTLDLIDAEGSCGLLMAGDIGDKKFCQEAVQTAVTKFGRLDILVNNAGEQHAQQHLEDISEDQLRRTFETNIFGTFFMTQAALPHLPQGASIICVTSVTAYRGQDLLIDYASTKGAILSFIRALSQKLAEKKIRVNGVAPGPIWTPLIPASFPKDKVETFGENSALGRPGQPNEVAPCLLFLACEDSSYMTGQVLHPNGGDLIGS